MTWHPTVYERHAPPAHLVADALSSSAQRTFWLEDAPGRRYPSLTASTSSDLAIVGGGYCGLWTAVLAKRRNPGLDVVLLEANTVGWAASGRNGGFCEASLTHGEANGQARWPNDYPTLARLGQENLDAFEADVDLLGLDVEFERTGALAVAVEEHERVWLGEMSGHRLDATAVRAEINSPIFLGGVWNKHECALVHPAKLASELARVASDLGVRIFERSHVDALDTDGRHGPARLVTSQAVVNADQVVSATNAFPALLRRVRDRTIPVYDYVLMTEPLTADQRDAIGWSNRQGFSDLANQFHYSRPTADGRILYGGYDAIYHPGGQIRARYEDRPETFTKLAAHFLATFPQLEGVRFSHRWAGVIDTCTRFAAFHGLARRGRVAYAAGFTGLGVGATRFAAEVMLDQLEGRETERTSLEMVRQLPFPFPPEPLTTLGVEVTRRGLNRADHRQGRRGPLIRTLDALGLGFDS